MAIDTKGKVLFTDFSILSKQEKLEQSEIFSEGSKELKKILLLLWECGVQTLGCCAGHEDGSSKPYIAFNIENLKDSELQSILIQLAKNPEGVKQVTFLAGTRANYPVFDKNGNVVGEEEKHKPATLNILIDGKFEESSTFNLLYSSLIEGKEYETKGLRAKDQDWIRHILIMRKIRLEDLNFYDYVMNNTWYNRVKGLDAKVTRFTINRDASAIEYSDDYTLIYDRVKPENKKDARMLNMYDGIIPTGRTEGARERVWDYEKVSKFKKVEQEPEQE